MQAIDMHEVFRDAQQYASSYPPYKKVTKMMRYIQKFASFSIPIAIIGIIFYGIFFARKTNPDWLSGTAKETVQKAMIEFCTNLHNGTMCDNSLLTRKQRWILSTRFTKSNSPPSSRVDQIFTKMGWKNSGSTRHGKTTFIYCNGTYSASFDMAKDYVEFVSFSSGDPVCDK